MKQLLYLCCFSLGMALSGKAQLPLNGQAHTDSLTRELQQATSDSIKARRNFDLSDYWFRTDTLKAKQYLEQGARFAVKYPYLQALYHYYAGNIYYQSDIALGETAFMKADSLLSRFHTKDAYLFRSKCWHNFGVLQQYRDNYIGMTEALLNKAIPFAQQSGDSAYLGKNYLDLGLVFKNNQQYEKAETYCRLAIQILSAAYATPDQLVTAYITAAENYVLSEKYPLAKTMLDSAKALLMPYPESQHFLDYYAAESMYFDVMRQHERSLASMDKGIILAKKLNKRYEEQRLLLQKFYALFNHHDFEKAKQVLTYLSEQREMMSLVSNKLQVYYGLAETYAGLGQMSQAYQWSKRYGALSDSVNESRLRNDINELEIKYKDAEKQKEIVTLKAKNQQAVLSAKNNRLLTGLLGSLSVFLLIVAIFSFFYYRSIKKLSVQKEINYQHQLKDLEQRQQLTIIRSIMEGEERERKRVARDLHDGLGGLLAGVKMDLSRISDHETKVQEQLQTATSRLDNSINELRRIARNMMPETLFKFGLVTALKDFSEGLEKEQTSIVLQCYGMDNGSINDTTQIMIYRIVQELVTNAMKHAKATEILVDCLRQDKQINITVEDNGIGFNPDMVNGNGIGLSNIQARVNYLNGTIDIQSAKDAGTTVSIQVSEYEVEEV